MTRLAPITALGLAAASTLFAGNAAAQQPPAPPPSPPAADVAAEPTEPLEPASPDVKEPGHWDTRVAVGAGLNLANNTNVGGQLQGTSVSFGLIFNAYADFNLGRHEWRNLFSLNTGVTRSPAVDTFVKTNDALSLESIYLFHVIDWFGPFFRAGMLTSMFPGRDVRPGKVSYQVVDANGAPVGQPIVPPGSGCEADPTGALPPACHTSFGLSDGFRPLTFKQSLGVFAQPLQLEAGTIELRLAAAAHEMVAKNQLAVADDAATNVIELHRMANATQFGPEVSVTTWGHLADRRFMYRANAELMVPGAHNKLTEGDKRSPWQLTNILLEAAINFRLVEWASLDYQLRVIRQPQVLDTFQVQNMLLLTFGPAYTTQHHAVPQGAPPQVPELPPSEPAPPLPDEQGAPPPPAPKAPPAKAK